MNSSTSAGVRPVDLTIRITSPWGIGGQSLQFVLDSPSDALPFHQRSVMGPSLQSPENFKSHITDQLEKLRRRQDVDGSPLLRQEVARDLETIGHDLFHDLFQGEMARIYRDVSDRVETLVVTSDEPWVPWEILRPFGEPRDDFFCLRHQMSRWLSGKANLVQRKRVRNCLIVEAGSTAGLTKAVGERRDLESQMKSAGIGARVLSPAYLSEVLAHLREQSVDLVHFIGHGKHGGDKPSEGKVLLQDGAFRVRHIGPEIEQKLRRERPIVFLNACQTGQSEQALTNLEGWAARWVRRYGCSAFLAPIWSVDDAEAATFAGTFYRELLAGQSLGAAVLAARKEAWASESGRVAALTYSLYGHPNAQILFGGKGSLESRANPTPPALVRKEVLPENIRQEGRSPARPRENAKKSSYAERESARVEGPILDPRTAPSGGLNSQVRRLILWAIPVLLIIAYFNWTVSKEATHDLDAPTGQDEVVAEVASDEVGEELAQGNASDEVGETLESEADTRELSVHPSAQPEPVVQSPVQVAVRKVEVPFSAPTVGKVAIIALDRKTGGVDRDVAFAIESSLAESNPEVLAFHPAVPGALAEALSRNDFSDLSNGSTGVPWGSERVLLAMVARRELPDHVVTSVSLSMSVKVFNPGTQLIEVSDSATHTGRGGLLDAALAQAATRCLSGAVAEL